MHHGSVVRQSITGQTVDPLRVMAVFAAFALGVGVTSPGLADPPAGTWKAGVASALITPQTPMWMAGYAARTRPAEGKLTDLWAKALALQDPAGERVVLVTLDLVGIDRGLSQAIVHQLQEKYGLRREQIALNCSHTHSGPVVARNLRPMHEYALERAQQELIHRYADFLQATLVNLVGQALENLQPAQIAWGTGRCTFAVNRRENREADVPARRANNDLRGPHDHDVPVLAVRDREGHLKAVCAGYACHATVLSGYEWSGDYPGYYQIALEASHPGAVAMFWAGCGADQNPLPRREVSLAQEYGRQLAAAVEEVLARPMRPLGGTLKASYAEIPLALDTLPTREQLMAQTSDSNRYIAMRARMLLEEIDAGRPLSPTYPYPIQRWQLGDGPQWYFLGGEVVVEYALRIKAEQGAERTWVAGYSNDVMAYIPSRRVLNEGGYEGGGAMVYYGLPTIWSPQVESQIIDEVRRQYFDFAPSY
jgi:hypothetical protein